MRFKSLFLTVVSLAFCGILSAQIDFYADDTVDCNPAFIKFSLDHTTVDTNTLTSVDWNFGNGQTVTSFNPPTVFYSSPGSYTVSIVIDGNTGSPITKTNYIVIHETVSADFEFEITTPPYQYRFSPLGTITEPAVNNFFRWSYYNDQSDMIRNITYIVNSTDQANARDNFEFPDTGYYTVALNIRSPFGCSDSVSQLIHVQEVADTTDPNDTTGADSTFVVGNVFAPESEGYFIIDPEDDAVVLSFQLFSRTGVIVYKAESPVIYWDGKTNSGRDLETGVYFYVLEALRGDPDKYYSVRGFIHLFR